MHKKVWLPKGLANTLRVNIPTKSAQWYHFMVEAVCVADADFTVKWRQALLYQTMNTSVEVKHSDYTAPSCVLYARQAEIQLQVDRKESEGDVIKGNFSHYKRGNNGTLRIMTSSLGLSHWAVWCSPPVAWCFHPSVQTLWGPTWPETWLKRLVPSETHAHTPLSARENGCTRRSYWQHDCWCFQEGIVN